MNFCRRTFHHTPVLLSYLLMINLNLPFATPSFPLAVASVGVLSAPLALSLPNDGSSLAPASSSPPSALKSARLRVPLPPGGAGGPLLPLVLLHRQVASWLAAPHHRLHGLYHQYPLGPPLLCMWATSSVSDAYWVIQGYYSCVEMEGERCLSEEVSHWQTCA